jgi:hypothetical protein
MRNLKRRRTKSLLNDILKIIIMPFRSKKQQSACYSTNGFGGKVDCKKWSAMTNQKSLPKRVSKTKKKGK